MNDSDAVARLEARYANVEASLACYQPAEREPLLARLRRAIGAGPHAVDVEQHARRVALLVLDRRAAGRVSRDFTRAVERSSEYLWVHDGTGLLVAASQPVARLVGWEPADLRGRRLMVAGSPWTAGLPAAGGRVRRTKAVLTHRDGHRVGYSYCTGAILVNDARLYMAVGQPLEP